MIELVADNLATTGTLSAGELRNWYTRRAYRAPRGPEARPPCVHDGAGSIRSPSFG